MEVWKRSAWLSVELYKCLAGYRDYGFEGQILNVSFLLSDTGFSKVLISWAPRIMFVTLLLLRSVTRPGLFIPSNIAKSMDGSSHRRKIRFLGTAKGSCAELKTQIMIGMEIGYIQKQHATAWVAETQELSAMLVGLMHSLKSDN